MKFGIASIAVQSINWYQVRVSPKKGFCCAYGVRWGRGTCSSIVKNAFAARGALFGTYTLVAQAKRCYVASVALSGSDEKNPASTSDKEDGGFCAKWAAMEGAWWCCFLPFIH
jgi:putative component of membrane protein insertase Oxa1/YidC/SpoIIIJ protein YidD